jgi:competence protein ComEC
VSLWFSAFREWDFAKNPFMVSMRKEDKTYQAMLQPLFYLFLSFAGGIVLERSLCLSRFLLIATLFATTAIAWFSYRRSWTLPAGIAILVGFAIAGGLLLQIETAYQDRGRIIGRLERGEIEPDEPVELYGELPGRPVPAPDRAYLELDADLMLIRGRAGEVSGRVRVTLWLHDAASLVYYRQLSLQPGTRLRIEAITQPAQRFKNPGMMDGLQWLEQKGYDLAVTVKSPLQIEVLEREEKRSFTGLIGRIQEYLFERIDAQFSKRTAGVIKASILGNDRFLDRSIAETFREGGTYHILVISGSHVALLAFITNGLLSFFIKRRWARFIIVASLIWTYSALVGAEMPVMRAVVMTTLGMTAMGLERRVRPANTIGSAGLLMLSYHPGALFEAGFQLTFISVTLILLGALPIIRKLAGIGRWQLRPGTPYPPLCPDPLRWLAELLFWQESLFEREMVNSPLKYRLEKNPWAKRLERFYLQPPLRAIAVTLITSTIVGLGLLPLSAKYFNRIAFIGILLNIAAELLMTALLLSFMLFVGADAFASRAGQGAAWLVEKVSSLFVASASPFDLAGPLSFRVANYSDWRSSFYVIYFLPVIFFLLQIDRWQPLSEPPAKKVEFRGRKIFISIAVGLGHIILLLAVVSPQFFGHGARRESGVLEVTFLDVGQGDAAFICFPAGTTMMLDSGGALPIKPVEIDAGEIVEDLPSIGEQIVSRYLWWRGVGRLDYLVSTHSHRDHIEGFRDLLKNFPSGLAVVSAIPKQDAEFDQFSALARRAGVPLRVWKAGERYTIDGVAVEVLWPPANQERPARLDNNQSLVLRLRYGRQTILLAGDIEEQAEREIVASGMDLSSGLLKSPHHGSKTSSSIDFLRKVSPSFAIISAPRRSRFNHPHREVLERYCRLGVHLYQTGLSGAITVTTDGRELSIKPFDGKEIGCP